MLQFVFYQEKYLMSSQKWKKLVRRGVCGQGGDGKGLAGIDRNFGRVLTNGKSDIYLESYFPFSAFGG